MGEIVFWQRIVSPHMAALARELAGLGHQVTFIAERSMSEARKEMGWHEPILEPAQLVIASETRTMLSLAKEISPHAIHLCQGVRSNGPIRLVQQELARLGRRQWAIIETVDDQGYAGILKRLLYTRICQSFMARGEGFLAIGQKTAQWLKERGVPSSRIVPFAYFLPDVSRPTVPHPNEPRPFRIAFAGRLVPLKRVQDLICAVAQLGSEMPDWEIWLIGDGPERNKLRRLASAQVPGRVRWFGTQPMARIPELLAQTDLLVLPSRHDGWGAVVSEALMVGTPVICSDRCGAAEVVTASGTGAVYPMGKTSTLSAHIRQALLSGPQTPENRSYLGHWANALGAQAGALYLESILVDLPSDNGRPAPPWLNNDHRPDALLGIQI